MLIRWTERPIEIARLLNPALTGVVLRQAVTSFTEEQPGGMPFELAFLVLPFCLHKDTVSRLPVRVSVTPLHVWIQREENRDVVIDIAERTKGLVAFTREALIFAIQRQQLRFGENASLLQGAAKPKKLAAFRKSNEPIDEMLKAANSVGRWIALSGTSMTLFSLLGIRPMTSTVLTPNEIVPDSVSPEGERRTLQLMSLALYNSRGDIRVLPFKTGQVNIITGASKTGEFSLFDIVDYCLGHSKTWSGAKKV